MDRSLDSLSSEFKPLAIELVARIVERGIMILIVQTSRTIEEHRINLANGTSKTNLSKHLPRSLRYHALTGPNASKADAIDLCPYSQYNLHGPDKLQWDDQDPAWLIMGGIGEALGLRWGGRWRDPHDPGHFELLSIPVSQGAIV